MTHDCILTNKIIWLSGLLVLVYMFLRLLAKWFQLTFILQTVVNINTRIIYTDTNTMWWLCTTY